MAQEVRKPFTFDFLDPLFAVVFHISITHQLTHELWFSEPSLLIHHPDPHLLRLMTLLLAYGTVVLSWIGYHRSIRSSPIKGFPRFLLDVALLFGYFLLFWNGENPLTQLRLLAAIYVLFVVWDILKKAEYRDSPLDHVADRTRARRGVSVVWAIVHLGLIFAYLLTTDDGTVGVGDWFIVSLALIAMVAYRIHKEWLHPFELLVGLGRRL